MTSHSEDPLFRSARHACTFALTYTMAQYDRPLMSRMADGPRPAGKGLVGLDGAGQAGMVLAEMHACGDLFEAILVARCAPHDMPCSCRAACCSGRRPNVEWLKAINRLVDVSAVHALAGCLSHYRLRQAIVLGVFDRKTPITDLAAKYDVARNTAAEHNTRIRRWLLGDKPGVANGVIGQEDRAWDAITERLQCAGLVWGNES